MRFNILAALMSRCRLVCSFCSVSVFIESNAYIRTHTENAERSYEMIQMHCAAHTAHTLRIYEEAPSERKR